jgi:hypothetical protein
MNAMTSAIGRTTARALTPAQVRRRNVRRARNFFLIAVMASLVSVAGHCLPGDDAPANSGAATVESSVGR